MDKKAKLLDRLQNLAIAVLSLSFLFLLVQTPLFGGAGDTALIPIADDAEFRRNFGIGGKKKFMLLSAERNPRNANFLINITEHSAETIFAVCREQQAERTKFHGGIHLAIE